jgi:hypothetical protein
MARVVNLDDLVPADVTLTYRDVPYKLPGDPPVEYILGLWRAQQEIGQATTLEEQADATADLYDRLLRVFQVADPAVTRLPFGFKSLAAITGLLMELYGLAPAEDEEDEEEEPDPLPPAAPTKSRRSRGSQSS